MKTVENFQQAAEKEEITFWPIHDCSMCGYECGYIIDGDRVSYDNGCDCVYNPPRQSNWQELADHYNRQQNEHVIAEMDAFWNFSNETNKD